MKSSSVPWPNKPSYERTPLSSRTKLRSFLLWRYLLQVQLSRRGRVVRRSAHSRPPNTPRILSRYGVRCPQTTDAVPLDLSVPAGSKRVPGAAASSNKGPPPSSPASKELTWKPLATPSFPHAPARKREWFPVTRRGLPPRPEPKKFFPVVRAPRKPREPQFHWTNSLNLIFLQDRQVPDQDDAKDKKEEGGPTPCVDSKAPDSTSVGSQPSKFEKSSLPSLKPSVTNPFKMAPSNTWPVDSAEHHTKPILVPPKFGTHVNSGFGKFASSTVGGGFPSAKAMGPLHPPTLSVTSPNETPKPTFKLKPPILGGSIAVTSSSFSIKRPAPKVESEGGADSSSPHKGNGAAASESPPEAKRPRTLPSAEGAPKSALPSGNEEKNGSGVSSSTSSEGKRSSSPSSSSSTSSSSSSSSCLSPSLGRENASISTTSNAVPTFVPLSSTNMEASSSEESPARVNGVGATSPPLSSKVGNAGFIFGQNLENRVSGVSSTSSGGASALRFSNGETNPSSSSTGLNLFTAAASNLATPSSTCDGGKSLSETSREFSLKEESLKTKYEEVQTVTGEEGEKNVIQMNCKLYGWANGSWQERGRGILRLNDRDIRDELHSRLVVRTQGTLTVMLNAKIWAEMSIEKPNDKSVRFTASDADGQPKIYLVMGSPKDITLLHNSLEYRVAAARSQTLDEREREADQLSDDVIPSLSV